MPDSEFIPNLIKEYFRLFGSLEISVEWGRIHHGESQ